MASMELSGQRLDPVASRVGTVQAPRNIELVLSYWDDPTLYFWMIGKCEFFTQVLV